MARRVSRSTCVWAEPPSVLWPAATVPGPAGCLLSLPSPLGGGQYLETLLFPFSHGNLKSSLSLGGLNRVDFTRVCLETMRLSFWMSDETAYCQNNPVLSNDPSTDNNLPTSGCSPRGSCGWVGRKLIASRKLVESPFNHFLAGCVYPHGSRRMARLDRIGPLAQFN